MVLAQAAENRKQRILLKREQAKQEYLEQQRLSNTIANSSETVNEEEPESTSKDTCLDDGEEQDEKKPKLDIPDSKTIISNVYCYLQQEYKYLQLQNNDNPELRPLAAIAQRTSYATGVSKGNVRGIVREEREKMAKRKRDSLRHSSNRNSASEDLKPDVEQRTDADSE